MLRAAFRQYKCGEALTSLHTLSGWPDCYKIGLAKFLNSIKCSFLKESRCNKKPEVSEYLQAVKQMM